MKYTRQLFLRLVAACFFLSFASLYIQWDGLFGIDGLEPAAVTLQSKNQNPNPLFNSILNSYIEYGLSIDLFAEGLLLIGMLASLLATLFPKQFAILPCLLLIQIVYLSFYLVGGTFLSFQWDILLLETGWLACAWSPWLPVTEPYKASHAMKWMIRFLIFKLMFQSGVVKVQANCQTWLSLSALKYHYATQCLPTPFAWYMHQLPFLVQQISVAACLIIEIPASFLLISPFKASRKIGVYCQVLLQVLILCTGNYNFFNFLTMVLCIPCLEDSYFNGAVEDDEEEEEEFTMTILDVNGIQTSFQSLLSYLEKKYLTFIVFTIAPMCYVTYLMIGVTSTEEVVELKLKITVKQTNEWIDAWLPIFLLIVSSCIGMIMLQEIVTSIGRLAISISNGVTEGCTSNKNQKIKDQMEDDEDDENNPRPKCWCMCGRNICFSAYNVTRTLCTACMIVILLSSTAITFISISKPLQNQLPSSIWNLYRSTSHLQLSSSYGLFRRMTGVGKHGQVARPEITLLGLDSQNNKWYEIEFIDKPSAYTLNVRPSIVAPHQPRLDWQMWFAALGSYQHVPWLIHFCDKLMKVVQVLII